MTVFTDAERTLLQQLIRSYSGDRTAIDSLCGVSGDGSGNMNFAERVAMQNLLLALNGNGPAIDTLLGATPDGSGRLSASELAAQQLLIRALAGDPAALDSISFGGGLPPPNPLAILGAASLVGWWRVDTADNQVDGGAISSVSDESTNGGAGVAVATTQPTMGLTRWNTDFAADMRALVFASAQKMFAASSALIAAVNGVNHPFEVWDVYQPLISTGSTEWAFENAFPNVLSYDDSGANGGQRFVRKNTTVFAGTATGSPGALWPKSVCPLIKRFQFTGSAVNFWVNGVLDPLCPIACTDVTSYANTKLSWGEVTGSATWSALWRERFVTNRVVTG